ncbi:hypothetical protein [Caldanaerobacter sp.]|uniref:hypothetical protein n=1 Tax=Caldanaerobacter sp. TaxID=2930036 RepID=UPI003C77FC13
MTNINCTLDCIYQKDGKCTLSNLSQIIKDKNNFTNLKDAISKEKEALCAYYIPAKNITSP